MSHQPPADETETPKEAAPRRRTAPWLLGGLVLFLLAVLVALQAFGLWAIFPPDTASDTLLLYALSSLNFVAFIVFNILLLRPMTIARSETCGVRCRGVRRRPGSGSSVPR